MGAVLVVDDNRDVCRVLSRLLRRSGVDVLCAHDGLEALDMLRQRLPRVVIIDIMMPGMDGLSVLREIRSDPCMAELPVCVFSALNGEEHRAAARAAGASEYWVKASVDFPQMLERLTPYLEKSEPSA